MKYYTVSLIKTAKGMRMAVMDAKLLTVNKVHAFPSPDPLVIWRPLVNISVEPRLQHGVVKSIT